MFNFIFTADKASKKPLYEQLYSYVADEIKNKNIKENERMPSKKALAKYLFNSYHHYFCPFKRLPALVIKPSFDSWFQLCLYTDICL